MTKPTITRKTAIEALACLNSASTLILHKLGTTNAHREATIKKMQKQLNVVVETQETK